MTEQESQIYEWAESQSYQDLSLVEREIVLAHMTPEEYEGLAVMTKRVESAFAADLKSSTPDPSSLAQLTDKISRHPDGKQKVAPWLIKLPLYWTAAACLVVFLLSYFLFSNSRTPEVATQERSVIQKVYDTLYVEKPIITEVIKTVYVNTNRYDEKVIETTYTPDDSEYLQEVVSAPSRDGIVKSFGNSGVDPNVLEQFKVQM